MKRRRAIVSWRAGAVGALALVAGGASVFACVGDGGEPPPATTDPDASSPPETSVPDVVTDQQDVDGGPTQPAWGPPVLLEAADGAANGAKVAMDDDGNAIAVWRQSAGTKFAVWATRFKASSGAWSAPLRLDSGEGETAQLSIAMNRKGTAIVIWRQADKDTPVLTKLWSRRFFPDGADGVWSGVTPVDHSVTGASTDPSVTVDELNNAHAAFTQVQTVWFTRFPHNAGKWDDSEPIGDPDAVTVAAPCIGVTPATNDLSVIWARSDGLKFDVWGNKRTFNGWKTAQALASTAGKKSYPSCDVTGSRATWLEEIDGGVSAMITYYVPVGADPGVPLGPGHADLADPDHRPRVAGDVAVWTAGQKTGVSRLTGANWVSGGSLSDGLGPTKQVHVARGGVIDAVAVWAQDDGARSNVWMSMRRDGLVWAPPQLVEAEDGAASSPHVAMTPEPTGGRAEAVIVWQQSDGTRDNIWARLFR